VEAVPRAWTHLLAIATGEPIDPATPTPKEWRDFARTRFPGANPPSAMTDGSAATYTPWQPGGDGSVDRAIAATRGAVFPLHGLDPHDPRD
jgi:acetoin utilization protein AcuC